MTVETTFLPVRLVWKGRLLVPVPEIDVPTMTAEIVEQTLIDLRGARMTLVAPPSEEEATPWL